MRTPVAAALCLLWAVPWIAGAEVTTVRPGEVKQSLFSTCFVDPKTGWMVGELGRIFRTTDGGLTWTRQDAGSKRPFFTTACIDEKTVWIAGKEGIVLVTRDGGASWTPVQTGSTRHLFGMRFASPDRGHAVGDFGTMLHTEDGGATWAKQSIAETVQLPDSALDTGVDPGDVNLYGVAYVDQDHAWVVGEFATIMASTDGGRTWRQQHAPIESTLFGVHFTDAQHGWAVGIDSVILRTEDGGTTWTAQKSPISQRSFYDVDVRGSTGWIAGDSGTMLKSTDGGASWVVEPLPIQLAAHWIRSVWLSADGTGLAVGNEGLVFQLEGSTLKRLSEKPARSAS